MLDINKVYTMTRPVAANPVPVVFRFVIVIILTALLCWPAASAAATVSANQMVRLAGSTISIDSTPQGAAIMIDGSPAGATPLRGSPISAGSHTVVLSLAGYTDYTTTVEVATGKSVSVSYSLIATSHGPIIIEPVELQKITPVTFVTTPASSVPWITGVPSTHFVHCNEFVNFMWFSGNTGNLPEGTIITLKIFDHPDNAQKTLPVDGVVIATPLVKDDGSWKQGWNASVPGGYQLVSGQEYVIRAIPPNQQYTKMGILYQCQPSDQWFSGSMTSPYTNCTGSTKTVDIFGSSGNISKDTKFSVTIYNYPGTTSNVLPASGVYLGDAVVSGDGTWRYTWDGTVPGYNLQYGEYYMIKVMLYPTNFLKFGTLYQCQPPLTDITMNYPVKVTGTLASTATVSGSSAAAGSSGQEGSQGNALAAPGEAVAVSPRLNPQPEPPSPIQSVFNFFNGLFGGVKTNT